MTGQRAVARLRRWSALGIVLLAAVVAVPLGTTPATAATYVPISGAGSTWSSNAIEAWRKDVVQLGMTVNYSAVGSTTGRNDFKNGIVDWAVSDIPYGFRDGANLDPPPTRGFTYVRPAGEEPAPVRPGDRGHLHRHHHELERPGDRQGQPGPGPAGDPDRAGGPGGRVDRDRAVHPVAARHPGFRLDGVLRATRR